MIDYGGIREHNDTTVKTIELFIEDRGYDVDILCQLPSDWRYEFAAHLAPEIQRWLRNHFVYLPHYTIGAMILDTINPNRRSTINER